MTTREEKMGYQTKYQNWIKSVGASLQVRLPNDQILADSLYTHANGIILRILQLSDDSDRILLVTKLNFPAEAQQLIAALPETKRTALFNETALLLTKMGIQFSVNMQESSLQEITLERTVFGESMTKQIFFDNLYRIIDAIVALNIKLRQKMGATMPGVTTGGNTTKTPYA
jgi:hypothetical protein